MIERLQVHVESTTSLGPVFEITPDRTSEPISAFPDVSNNLRIAIDVIDMTFDDALQPQRCCSVGIPSAGRLWCEGLT